MRTALLLTALLCIASCSSSDDSQDLADYEGPRLLTDDLVATVELVIDGQQSSLSGDCNSQVSAMAVNARGADRSLLTVNVFYPGPNSSTPAEVFINVYEPRYAYVDEITGVDVSKDGLSGSVDGSGLLYEDSTTAPADVSITWSCQKP